MQFVSLDLAYWRI